MSHRESPLYWSFPLGTWFFTEVRISIFFPLIVLVLCLNFGLQLGLLVGGLLFLSVLFHEFGHVMAARYTGGSCEEILIWPLGGLAFAQPGGTFRSQFLTAAAGPAVNLIICLITLGPIVADSYTELAAVFNPMVLPLDGLSNRVLLDLLVLIFTVNYVQLLINLIPVYPLDGGRMLHSYMSAHWGGETSTDVYLKVGFVCAFLLMLAGLIVETGAVWLVFIGAMLIVFNIMESVQLRTAESYEDSFMGYDFSQGYTSLERSAETGPPKRPGPLQRWREKRRAEKRRREEEKRQAEEAQLDALLEKVSTEGMESLTEAEKRQLHRASNRYKNRQNQEE